MPRGTNTVGNMHKPLLLTWFNFNPSLDKQLHASKVWDEITYPFQNFNVSTLKFWNG